MTSGTLRWFGTRAIGLIAMLASFSTVQAGITKQCRQQETDGTAFAACIEAEHNRSTNQLRAANLASQEAVNKQVRETGRKAPLQQFRAGQARYVRQRAAACRKAAEGIERQACEADMNFPRNETLHRIAR